WRSCKSHKAGDLQQWRQPQGGALEKLTSVSINKMEWNCLMSERASVRSVIIMVVLVSAIAATVVLAQQQTTDSPLTGNWVASSPSNDGYLRKTYFNLKQEGAKITGTIRATQFFYTIKESTGGPDGFTLLASMQDGKSERRVQYEGKL